LIFKLYPKEMVFVDNRPEAYTADFFEKTYIAAMENEGVWQQLDNQYHFGSIVVTPLDNGPWLKSFLERRRKDRQWQVVLNHPWVVVMERNQDL